MPAYKDIRSLKAIISIRLMINLMTKCSWWRANLLRISTFTRTRRFKVKIKIGIKIIFIWKMSLIRTSPCRDSHTIRIQYLTVNFMTIHWLNQISINNVNSTKMIKKSINVINEVDKGSLAMMNMIHCMKKGSTTMSKKWMNFMSTLKQ